MPYQTNMQTAKTMIEQGKYKLACGTLRPVLEKYLGELCFKENIPLEDDRIYTMIHTLFNAQCIDKVKRSRFLHLNSLGNAGAHPGNDEVSRSDATFFIEVLSEYLGFNIEEPEIVDPKPKQQPQPYKTNDGKCRNTLISAYYLSEHGHTNLSLGNQGETIDFIANALKQNRNTLKNYRDYFDPITNSTRKGWHNVPTPPKIESIFNEFKMVSEKDLRTMVLEFINR